MGAGQAGAPPAITGVTLCRLATGLHRAPPLLAIDRRLTGRRFTRPRPLLV